MKARLSNRESYSITCLHIQELWHDLGGYDSLLGFNLITNWSRQRCYLLWLLYCSFPQLFLNSACVCGVEPGIQTEVVGPRQGAALLARGLLLSSMSSSSAQSRAAPQSETKVKGRVVNTHTPSLPHPSPTPSPPASATPLLFVSPLSLKLPMYNQLKVKLILILSKTKGMWGKSGTFKMVSATHIKKQILLFAR